MAAVAPGFDALIGTHFADRYAVELLLGAGGMGAVYRVSDLALRETVALKLLRHDASPGLQAVPRFREEVRLARRVTHENVARVHDLGVHQGFLYLTMEYVEGETLRERLQRLGGLSLFEALRVGVLLCKGLAAAHGAGVVHRDIKPPNVLLSHEGRVVLSDFGIARSVEEHSELTQGALGTRRYMAPEQALGRPVDHRADLYALGLVLTEMVTGELFGEAETAPALVAKGVNAALAGLVASCLAFEPDARPASCAPLIAAMEGELTSSGLQEARGEPGDGARGRSRGGVSTGTAATGPSRTGAAPHGNTGRSTGGHTIRLPHGSVDPSLAVLPFRYRGPPEQAYLADAIADELIDVLATQRELRVLGGGMTAKYRDERDPCAVGTALAVDSVIDGTLQMSGDRGRVTTRLMDVQTGEQRWTDSMEGPVGDIWEFQQRAAASVAEKLRVQIVVTADRAPSGVIESYLSARRKLRQFLPASEALGPLDAVIEAAPDFRPALAAHALASSRSWFGVREQGMDEASCRASVERALAAADSLSDTHFAAAHYASNRGDYPAAVESLRKALSIAPTNSSAQELLGVLEVEAGRADRGVARLRMVIGVEPEFMQAWLMIARQYAIRGWHDAFDAIIREAQVGKNPMPVAVTRVRRAVWWRMGTELSEALADLGRFELQSPSMRLTFRIIRGEVDPTSLPANALEAQSRCPRGRALERQMSVDALMFAGLHERALTQLERLVEGAFIDLEWMQSCPNLEPIRSHPRFVAAARQVQTRVQGMWA